MSGIAGIIHFDAMPVERRQVQEMTAAMQKRGPDGISHWVEGPIAFGHCALRTTPESLEEALPLANEDGSLVLTMDGRVDNRDELRRELCGRGARLRDASDAELVLRAFEVWGEACPDKIIGEYVFFICDPRERTLFGARDAVGTRHFYYQQSGNRFLFASEISAILAVQGGQPRLNESRLLDYIVEDFDRDDEVGTFYEGILRLPAGHCMRADRCGVKTWRYWHPGELAANRFSSIDECAEAFLEQFRVAVKCRLRSCGPVGAMLSGGLDSSSIAGLIREEYRSELSSPLKTFSLIGEDRRRCADWKGIQAMLQGGWFEAEIANPAIAANAVDSRLRGISRLNEPFALSHGLTDEIVYEMAARSGCRVVLDGIPGDLLFYGSDRSLGLIAAGGMYGQLPGLVGAFRRHRLGSALPGFLRTWVTSRLPMQLRTACRALRQRMARRDGAGALPRELADLLRQDGTQALLQAKRERRVQSLAGSETDNDQQAHARYFTSGLVSFAHEVHGQLALSMGVEPRSPFSDRRLVEFAIQMPLQAKLCTHWYKHTLRKSMQSILPREVLWRREIAGHPGWQVYARVYGLMAQSQPAMWNGRHIANRLGKWVDAKGLLRAHRKYEECADFNTGCVLYSLAVLAEWLANRNLRAS